MDFGDSNELFLRNQVAMVPRIENTLFEFRSFFF